MTAPAGAAQSRSGRWGRTARERLIAEARSTAGQAAKADGRHARGHRRQTALIGAARALFIEQGYRGTTLEAIIARAGGSRETIYRVFGGKHGLLGAVIAQTGERFAASILAASALGLPPREALTRFGDQLIAIWSSEEGRAVHRAIVSEGLDAPDLVEAWYRGGTELSIRALARYLEAQTAAGRLHPLDPPLVARQFITLLMGEMAFPLIAPTLPANQPPPDPAVRIARCVDLLLRAYLV